MKKLSRIYQSIPVAEEQMYDDVKGFLTENGISGSLMYNIMLVISEAFTNALTHANQYAADKTIDVKLTVNNDMVCADITDEGPGDLNALGKGKKKEELSENGRGLDLIKYYADGVEYSKSEVTGGLKVSVKFSRARQRQEELKK
jgi:anti-sigma regulatory factor (Ser/Thr protein kinase)